MKKNITNSNYAINNRNMQLLISEEFAERIVPSDDSVRLLEQIVEEMRLEPLERAYKRNGRRYGTSLRTMFKIIIYGAMERRNSSREIETSCKRDINFIWLLNGEKAPHHRTICRFRKDIMSECSEELFYELVMKLSQKKEIKFENVFVDGTKIEANANKYSFVWKKSTNKYEHKVAEKLEKLIQTLQNKYGILTTDEFEIYQKLKDNHPAPFVHGRGRRKSELQRDIEELEALLTRRVKYEAYHDILGERNSFSKTDKDATFMRMKDDHMRNGQLKPGYNLQIAVEGEYITGMQLSSERSDQMTLIPLLEQMDSKIGVKYTNVTADAGYESEENYTYFENKNQTCYIKPQNYERSKKKKFKSNMALRENMQYNQNLDEYICQNNKKLKPTYCSKRKSKSGFESNVTNYECEDCTACKYKESCTKAKGNRKMQVSKMFIKQREKSLLNITSEMGILLRMNRSIQVEGVFGVIKQDYRFRRFLHRGNTMVTTEFFIIAMGYNINKFHNKIQQNRTGSQLHEKLIA